jgi:hypothetical protein
MRLAMALASSRIWPRSSGVHTLQVAGCAPEDVCEARGGLGLAHQRALIRRWELGRLCAVEGEDIGLFLRAHAFSSLSSHPSSAAHRWASVGGFSASPMGGESQCAALAALSSPALRVGQRRRRGWGVCMFGVPLFEHRGCNLSHVEKWREGEPASEQASGDGGIWFNVGAFAGSLERGSFAGESHRY